jgi:hypothetical protein
MVFGSALHGYVAKMSAAQALATSRDPTSPTWSRTRWSTSPRRSRPVQWDLDRVDQRTLPVDNAYTYSATGNGVTAYVIDTAS